MRRPTPPRYLIEVGIALAIGIGLGLSLALVANPGLLNRPLAFSGRGRQAAPPPTATASATAASGFALIAPSPNPTAAPATATPSPPPSATAAPSPSHTPQAPAPTSTPAAPEGMVLIPAGFFQMGSTLETFYEAPAHPVLLDAYYLDLYEVTNAQYQACIAAGACTEGRRRNSFTREGYSQDPAYADYPVIGVTWDQAQAFCAWAGKRLPTEAEWEYAAKGPGNRRWPWGDAFDPAFLPAGARDTQPVGSYPQGVSVFGVFDLAGNVREWVADAYNADFYAAAPPRNPRSDVGGRRIYRGGSFANLDPALYTTSRRVVNVREYYDVDLGFRCAQDLPSAGGREAPAEVVAEFCRVYQAYRPDGPCP